MHAERQKEEEQRKMDKARPDWNGKGLSIGELHVRAPIVQGGMGIGVSGYRLASAVAEAGGIGVLSAVGLGILKRDLEEDAPGIAEKSGESLGLTMLRREIRAARKRTKGVLGVNIMTAVSDFQEAARVAAEEGIDIIFSGAGLPLTLPECLAAGSRTKLVPIVSSAKAAKLIARRWKSAYGYVPDAFVLEGPKAGGHLGFSAEQIEDPAYRLQALLPQVLEEAERIGRESGKEIPVIAAGGIYTGADIAEMLALGAAGVQMATRFVATEECDADEAFKKAYVQCRKEDIAIIQSPVGMPGRAIWNTFLKEAREGKKRPEVCRNNCITPCPKTNAAYCISEALVHAFYGRLDQGFAFIGANGYRIREITTVEKLFKELEEGFRAAEGGQCG